MITETKATPLVSEVFIPAIILKNVREKNRENSAAPEENTAASENIALAQTVLLESSMERENLTLERKFFFISEKIDH
jgi:hypothetical protein